MEGLPLWIHSALHKDSKPVKPVNYEACKNIISSSLSVTSPGSACPGISFSAFPTTAK